MKTDEGSFGFLGEWLRAEVGGMNVVTSKVIRPARLLVDRLLLTNNLVTDLVRHVSFVVQNHVLLHCHAATVVMIVNWSEITLSIATIANDH